MKANAIGLEVVIGLNEEEFSDLRRRVLREEMRFRGVGPRANEDKQIPFELRYSREQKDLLEVFLNPKNVYFGEAKNVTFSINNDFYHGVLDQKSYGCRFSIGGKLKIKIT